MTLQELQNDCETLASRLEDYKASEKRLKERHKQALNYCRDLEGQLNRTRKLTEMTEELLRLLSDPNEGLDHGEVPL